MIKTASLFLFAIFALSGCSYMVNGVNDKISINSNNPSTEIYLNGNSVGKGFALIPLRRGDKYTITGKAPGCTDASFEGKWKLNSLAVISFLTLPVDLAIGTAWDVNQNSIMLNPICQE